MNAEERAKALRKTLMRGKPPILMAVTLYPDRNDEIEAALASAIVAAEDETLERAAREAEKEADFWQDFTHPAVAQGCRAARDRIRSLKSSKGGGR